MTERLVNSMLAFSLALEEMDIDPSKVTIVLEPADMERLKHHAPDQRAAFGGPRGAAEGQVKIIGIAFQPWRRPA